MTVFDHKPVLLEETVKGLNIKADGTYVDCTLGGGGHSQEILSQLNEEGRLYSFDQDETAIHHAEKKFENEIESGQLVLIHANFANLQIELMDRGIDTVDGIVYDLGVSSPQLDEAERGFSYHQDAPLDMRMDRSQELSAYQIVNHYPYAELVKIFYRYGEERFSKQIARQIETSRKKKPIQTTGELVELIKQGIPAAARRKGGHPAKRVFQAIRIAVNNELEAIETSLEQALAMLNPGGRIAVISFHSLEDGLVKSIFREYATVEEPPAGVPILAEDLEEAPIKIVNRKPITASLEELEENNRSRSAKLRIVEKN